MKNFDVALPCMSAKGRKSRQGSERGRRANARRRSLFFEPLEDRLALAVVLAGPGTGTIASLVSGLFSDADFQSALGGVGAGTAAYVAFPGEVNDVTLQDTLELFIELDEGNDHIPVFVVPPAFNADFISNIDIGFSFFAEATVPIGELVELPDVSAIIPNGGGLLDLIPGVGNLTDLVNVLGFSPGIDIFGIPGASLDLSAFLPTVPGPIGDAFQILTDLLMGFNSSAVTVATLDGNDSIDLRGLSQPVTVLAGPGNDDIFDGEGDPGTATVLNGGPGDDGFFVNFFKNGTSPLTTMDGGDGADTILMELTNTDDTLTLSMDTQNRLVATMNGITQRIEVKNMEKIQITGDTGDDRLFVDLVNGVLRNESGTPLLVNWDGGDGTDLIELRDSTATTTSSEHIVGPFASGTGTILLTRGAAKMTLNYEGMDPVAAAITDRLAGPVTINATPNVNAINVSQTVAGACDEIADPHAASPTSTPRTCTTVEVDSDLFLYFDNKTEATINAGSGADTVDLQVGAEMGFTGVQPLTVNGQAGDDLIAAESGLETLLNLKLDGGAGADQLIADAVLIGGPGDDLLVGGPGNDTLDGGAGDDTLVGAAGDNSYTGGPGFDTILTEGTPANDTLLFNQTAANTLIITANANTGTNTVTTVEAVRVAAAEGDDTIQVNIEETLGTSLRFSIDGGPNSGADLLTFVDDGAGDRILLRQGPDDQSGTIYPDALGPITFERINQVRFTPLNTVTGGTGDDAGGRIVVLDQDPFEFNGSLPNSVDFEALASAQHNPTIDLPDDEDWYHFRAPKIGTFSFEILFDRIATLPGAGELKGEVYRENGTLIATSVDIPDGDVVSFSAARLEDYYLRVLGGAMGQVSPINVYDVNLIEVDLVGPQVFDPDGAGPQQAIQVGGHPDFNLFDVKPSGPQGPTPLVNSIVINLRDILNRTQHLPSDLFNRPVPNGRAPGDLYPALDALVAAQPGHFEVRGDHNGIIPIHSINVVNQAPVVGQIATATVELVFVEPLPDDRFSLTIRESLIDPPGNAFDGNSNAAEPNGAPTFPSGDAVAGGPFVARFTVDSRAELGIWAAGSIYVETNGNFVADPENKDGDNTNEDITYTLGFTTDNVFAGNFVAAAGGTADGFDKVAAYGRVAGSFRWLIDVNNDSVVDVVVADPMQQNGLPVAGNFDGSGTNGDEVGLKNDVTWFLDKDHDFMVETVLQGDMVGYPFVGDFDGDGVDDLGAWTEDSFKLDLSGDGIDGFKDQEFTFGFPGVRERPIAADLDGDGHDDLGLWAPDRTGAVPTDTSEWYIFISGGNPLVNRITANPDLNGGNYIPFTPAPFGKDIFAEFGDDFALPVVGNFDPPVTKQEIATKILDSTNPADPYDVNNDGFRSPVDVLWLINELNRSGSVPLEQVIVAADYDELDLGAFLDPSGDGVLSPLDPLLVINYLNDQNVGASEGESAASEGTSALELAVDPSAGILFVGQDAMAVEANESLGAGETAGAATRADNDSAWRAPTADLANPRVADRGFLDDELESLLDALADDLTDVWGEAPNDPG